MRSKMWTVMPPDDLPEFWPSFHVSDEMVQEKQAFLKKYLKGSRLDYTMEFEGEGLISVRMVSTGNEVLKLIRAKKGECI